MENFNKQDEEMGTALNAKKKSIGSTMASMALMIHGRSSDKTDSTF